MDSCMCCNLQPFLNILRVIITVLQWTIPLLLLVLGTIDIFKAIAKANDKKVVKDARASFIKRLIYGVVIFLVPFLVRVIFRLVADIVPSDGDLAGPLSWISCFNSSKEEACSGCDSIYKPSDETNNDNSNNNLNNNGTSNNQVTCYYYKVYDTSCSNEYFIKWKDNFKNVHYDADGYCDATTDISEANYSDYVWYETTCTAMSGFIKKYDVDNLGNMICSFKTDKLEKYSTSKPSDYVGDIKSKICSSANYCNAAYYELCN